MPLTVSTTVILVATIVVVALVAAMVLGHALGPAEDDDIPGTDFDAAMRRGRDLMERMGK